MALAIIGRGDDDTGISQGVGIVAPNTWIVSSQPISALARHRQPRISLNWLQIPLLLSSSSSVDSLCAPWAPKIDVVGQAGEIASSAPR